MAQSNSADIMTDEEDKGGYAPARHRCPHAADHMHPLPSSGIDVLGTSCSVGECGEVGNKNVWLCSECHIPFCGRYARGHMMTHYDQTGHCIAVGFGDLSFWCYGCESYISHKTIPNVYSAYCVLHLLKFNEPVPEPPSFPSEAKEAAANGQPATSHPNASKHEMIDENSGISISTSSSTSNSVDTTSALDVQDGICPVEGLTDEQIRLPKLNRILGAIYGNVLGDAYGLSTEFMDRKEVLKIYGDNAIPFPNYQLSLHSCRWERGDWTDDSDQLILILDSILESDGPNERLFALKLRHWIRNGFIELGDSGGMGLGMTVGAVCHQSDFLTHPHDASRRIWEQTGKKLAANGAVMRTAILGVYQYEDIEAVIANTERYAKVTHFDGRCVASCVAITVLIARLLQGVPASTKEEIDALITESTKYSLPLVQDEFKPEFIRHMNASLEELKLDEPNAIGYTLKCFGSGAWAFRQTSDWVTTMNLLVREAGDADTNGAVAGAVIGAKLGYTALPQSWLQAMPHKKWLDVKVLRFLRAAGIIADTPHTTSSAVTSTDLSSSSTSASSSSAFIPSALPSFLTDNFDPRIRAIAAFDSLRDDCNAGAAITKPFVSDCSHVSNGSVEGIALGWIPGEQRPFACFSGDFHQFLKVRLLQWPADKIGGKLQQADEFEGYTAEEKGRVLRRIVNVRTDGGRSVRAYLYVLRKVDHQASWTPIESGDWLRRGKSSK